MCRAINAKTHTMHLKDPLVLFGFKGFAFSPPLLLLSYRMYMLWHCSSAIKKDHLKKNMAVNGLVCRCAFKHLIIHSFIHSFILSTVRNQINLKTSLQSPRHVGRVIDAKLKLFHSVTFSLYFRNSKDHKCRY